MNSSSVTLKSGDQKNEVIPKNQIAKRTNSPSSMPEMKYILSKKEIRDVVSFLAEQKEDTYKASAATGGHGPGK